MYIFSTKGHENSCPVCNFKMSDFMVHQRLGCSFCYIFLPKAIKNLVKTAQDGCTTHEGKRNSRPNSLFGQFFNYVLDKEAEDCESHKEDCEKIKTLLNDYF